MPLASVSSPCFPMGDMPLPFSLHLITAHSCLLLLREAAERGERRKPCFHLQQEGKRRNKLIPVPPSFTHLLSSQFPTFLFSLPSIVVLYTRSCGVVQQKKTKPCFTTKNEHTGHFFFFFFRHNPASHNACPFLPLLLIPFPPYILCLISLSLLQYHLPLKPYLVN
ncbi:hypothetical protein K457DRAFT_750965 [Linnemannia elongata AG-77]|uniref:Uncharacterized protein n=1 Tax=Linnemannia elongata AG-77 TaxID=1314771 RepID=A0A197JN58_9FUNG|nr:hypothetical protein K457DRAFT_750965 [Linnemannia elongata AG-77]